MRRLGATLGAAPPELEIRRLSGPGVDRLAYDLPGRPALLGPDPRRPVVHDLSLAAGAAGQRDRRAIERLLLVATTGPAAVDLRASPPPWHYYIAQDGRILRLRDERAPDDAAEEGPPRPGSLSGRAVIVAIEGEPGAARRRQRSALIWLIRTLSAELQIDPSEIYMQSGRRPQRRRSRA